MTFVAIPVEKTRLTPAVSSRNQWRPSMPRQRWRRAEAPPRGPSRRRTCANKRRHLGSHRLLGQSKIWGSPWKMGISSSKKWCSPAKFGDLPTKKWSLTIKNGDFTDEIMKTTCVYGDILYHQLWSQYLLFYSHISWFHPQCNAVPPGHHLV